MSILLTISLVLRIALRIYTYILWARLILDWVRVLKPTFRPKGFVLVASDIVYTLTDPPIKTVRKVLPPIRIGTIMLDVAWLIVLIGCRIIMALLP